MARGARPILYGPRGGLVNLGTWPGQPGNPVGFAATPASSPAGAWPGSFQNGIGAWPGLPNPCSMRDIAVFFNPGTPTIPNNITIAFLDIDGGGGTNPITASGLDSGPALTGVKFVGCRFQSAAIVPGFNVECFKSGSTNITFSYCSVTPRRSTGPYFSKVLSPAVFDVSNPGAWPSASVGTGLADGGGGVNPIPGGGAGQYQTAFLSATVAAFAVAGVLTIDHCDMWGHGFGIEGATGSNQPITITDNWIHDNRFPGPPAWDPTFAYLGVPTSGGNPTTGSAFVTGSNGAMYCCIANGGIGVDPTVDASPGVDGSFWHWIQASGDHSESIGYTTGGAVPPANWIIKHNTIATLGNTENFAWQVTSSNYQNISMINNYITGCHDMLEMGTLAAVANTGWVVTDNVFATDLLFNQICLSHSTQPIQPQFTSTGNLWRRNRLHVYPGDTWSPMIWNSGTAYTVGLQAIDIFNYHMYQCLVNNTNVQPHTNGTDWLDLGPAEGIYVYPSGGEFFSTTDWAL